MKAGYEIFNFCKTEDDNVIFVFNDTIANCILNVPMPNNEVEKYILESKCIGLWKIKCNKTTTI